MSLIRLDKNSIPTVYYALTATTTLATAMIWGINTIFLLNAGLSNTQAFSANAIYSLAQVIFEVPTGVVADTKGRTRSFLYGAFTLCVGTFLYVIMYWSEASFYWWAAASALLGIGYTFFSGAIEAWFVDAMNSQNLGPNIQKVMAKNQAVAGVMMLFGSVLGGVLAEYFGLGLPYVIRSILLIVAFATAFIYMKDIGFSPDKEITWIRYTKSILSTSGKTIKADKNIAFTMLSGALAFGAFGYTFYALQPYLLELAGNNENFILAGASASLMAVAQIIGGTLSAKFGSLFKNVKYSLITGTLLNIILLICIGLTNNLILVLALIASCAGIFAFLMPSRQAMLNSFLPSKQRATLLSIDNLGNSLSSSIVNPPLGKVADVHGYGPSFVVAGLSQLSALPFLIGINLRKELSDKEIKDISDPGATNLPT